MRVLGRWLALCLTLTPAARADVLGGGWTHDLDLSTAFGSGTVTTAFSETSAFGLFDGRLRLGAGPRLLGVFGPDDAAFTTADAGLISSGAVNTITASKVRIGALNLALSARVRIVAGLELGANIDVIGVGFGPSRAVTATTGNFQGVHTAAPPAFNLLALGRNDKGALDSEFHLSYWFGERLVVRAGVSHLVTELVTTQPLDDGNDRFRRVLTLFFVAGGYRL